jgi:hypothetical protein
MIAQSANLMQKHDGSALTNLAPEMFECIMGHFVTAAGICAVWKCFVVYTEFNTLKMLA